MNTKNKANSLIIPIYINEKIVLDMLAILEDGFSKVSQVNYAENLENKKDQNMGISGGTTATLLSRLLKIDITAGASHESSSEVSNTISKEKIHTNVSLLSKFRGFLENEEILKKDFTVEDINIGDFIELEGELEKNPLINCLEIIKDVLRLSDTLTDKPKLGERNKEKGKKQEDSTMLKQIEAITGDLKHSGTIDFILTDSACTAVLSAQEQYLANDNISEILGGRFKVLGKVISICRNEEDSIDLLRKTTLSVFPENMLDELVSGFRSEEIEQFHFPEMVTKIAGPAVMIIPVAIYA